MIYTYLFFNKPLDESVVVGFVLGAWVIQVNLYRKDSLDLILDMGLNIQCLESHLSFKPVFLLVIGKLLRLQICSADNCL